MTNLKKINNSPNKFKNGNKNIPYMNKTNKINYKK